MLKITGKDLINYLKPNLTNTLVKEVTSTTSLTLDTSIRNFNNFFNTQESTSNLRFFNAPKQFDALESLCESTNIPLLPQHILLYKLLKLVYENTSSALDIEGSQGRALMRLMEGTFSVDIVDLSSYIAPFSTELITPLNLASVAFKALFLTREEILELETLEPLKTIIAYMLCVLFLPLTLKYKSDSFKAMLPYYFALGITVTLDDLLNILIKETKAWN